MRFLLASLYRPQYREIIGRLNAPSDPDPMVLHVECPKCGQDNVAEPEPGTDVWELKDCEYKATVRLNQECPDHPHWFMVQL